MAKHKTQEARKPRKSPDAIKVKPNAPSKPTKKFDKNLDQSDQAKKRDDDNTAHLDPHDETDAEIIRMSDKFEAIERRQMQRAKKLTHTAVRAALRETAGILLKAAEILGVARSTLYQYIRRHKLEGELEAIRDDILDRAESAIKLAIMGGNLQIAMWYLTKMGGRRGYAERHTFQQLDKSGQPIDPRDLILAHRPVLSPDIPPPASPVL